MIDLCGRPDLAFLLALNTQRMNQQISCASLLPLVCVAALCAASSALVMLPGCLLGSVLVSLTEALTSDQGATLRCRAWLEWPLWH